MGLLNEELASVPELGAVTPGPYELMVVSAEKKNSKAGDPMIRIGLEIPSEPNAATIYEYFMEPLDSWDQKKINAAKRKFGNFAASCGYSTTDPVGEDFLETVIGRSCQGELTIRVDESGQYPDSNQVRTWLPA